MKKSLELDTANLQHPEDMQTAVDIPWCAACAFCIGCATPASIPALSALASIASGL